MRTFHFACTALHSGLQIYYQLLSRRLHPYTSLAHSGLVSIQLQAVMIVSVNIEDGQMTILDLLPR